VAGTQTWARESSVTHKSAITDHAVEENHVVDWDKAKVVDEEAQREIKWIKEALWIRKTPMCMNRDAGSYQLGHTWDQVISRSRAPSSCKQSRRDQMSDGHRNVVNRWYSSQFVKYKLGVMTRRCLYGSAPRYLAACFVPVSTTASKQHLSVAGPMFWNSLPRNLRDPSHTAAVFGRSLKSFLFSEY